MTPRSATGRLAIRGHFIGGQYVDSAERIGVVNPANGETVGSAPAGSAEDVDAAVSAARAAFTDWSTRSDHARARVIRGISEGLDALKAQIAETITTEMGAPTRTALAVQASLPVVTSGRIADILDAGYSAAEECGNSLIFRSPVGVVGCITPWNFPLHQIVAKVVPALAAGCTVVLKPSEIAPFTAQFLSEVVSAAGLPDGALNIVYGSGGLAGAALAGHLAVDMVSFTGSTAVGRQVAATAASTVKKVALELGGKSAAIILDDADLRPAVKLTVGGCFVNSGQSCSALTRMLVHEAQYDEALELAVAAAARYPVGDPTSPDTRIGPLASFAQRRRVEALIDSALREGARRVFGAQVAIPDGGAYVAPTVFADVMPQMTIAREEIFGPVLSVMSYRDERDAVRIANETIYGLSGAVFSRDQDRAVRVARQLRTGQVDINGGAYNPLAPFGGFRQSGNGRELGRYGMDEFCELQSVQL